MEMPRPSVMSLLNPPSCRRSPAACREQPLVFRGRGRTPCDGFSRALNLGIGTGTVQSWVQKGPMKKQKKTARGAAGRCAQRKRRHTYPELERARRCCLVVFGVEVGGRWSREAAQFVPYLRAHAQQRHLRPCVLLPAAPGCSAGVAFFPSQRSELLQHRCWSCRCTGNAKAAALSLNCMRSLRTHAGLQLLPQAVSLHAQREQTHVASKACAGTGVWDELREKGV